MTFNFIWHSWYSLSLVSSAVESFLIATNFLFSYTLFKMFDDLVLLAKGGLIVYHGPARKVEEYFAGLGINVPERVNPPDHYIDILEGIVVPSASSGVNYKELPVRWMLHNGYPIPPRYAAVCCWA